MLDKTLPDLRAVTASYPELVADLVQRRHELGLSQLELSEAIGMADGYIGKLEAFHRWPRPQTVMLWADALGLRLATIDASIPAATARLMGYKPRKTHF